MNGGLQICPACGLKVEPGTAECPIDGTVLREGVERTLNRDRLIDAQVGEYLVKGHIGEGGMGVVYEGVHPVIGKRVAIKVLRKEIASDPHEAARLLTEARTVNAIGHRGIIDIFSLGRLADGRQYLVMEFLVGVSLHEHIQEFAPLQIADTLQILDEMLAALSAAHGAGVIHRDLKPNNIFLVTQPDGARYVKLLDFGLAKQSPFKHGETPQTRVSRVLGTPEFMAPEQARGDPVGPRTDLYALGCVAFEMLTARLPFEAATGWEIVNQHLNTPAPAPSMFASSVPAEIDALVLGLLAKEPGARPASAELVRQEIKRIRKLLQVSSTRLFLAPPAGAGGAAAPDSGVPTPIEPALSPTFVSDPSRRATMGMPPPADAWSTGLADVETVLTLAVPPKNVAALTLDAPREPGRSAQVRVGARETVAQTEEQQAHRPSLAPNDTVTVLEPVQTPAPARRERETVEEPQPEAVVSRPGSRWSGFTLALVGGSLAAVTLGVWVVSTRVPAAAPELAAADSVPQVAEAPREAEAPKEPSPRDVRAPEGAAGGQPPKEPPAAVAESPRAPEGAAVQPPKEPRAAVAESPKAARAPEGSGVQPSKEPPAAVAESPRAARAPEGAAVQPPVGSRAERPATEPADRLLASVELNSEPPTEVLLGARTLGKTPLVTRLPPGRRSITFVNRELELRQTVVLQIPQKGLTQTLRFAKGSLVIEAPAGAAVYLDGQRLGKAPVPTVEVFEGEHRLRVVEGLGGRVSSQLIHVKPGAELRLAVAF